MPTVARAIAATLLVLCLGALHPAFAAAGPSFDCGQANSSMQDQICGDRALSVAEGTVGELYAALLSRAGTHRDAIAALQEAWSNQAAAICSVPKSRDSNSPAATEKQAACLLDGFRARIKSLRDVPLAPFGSLSMDQLLAIWAVPDALLSLPYAPDTSLAVFRSVNDGAWGKLPGWAAPDAAAWGEILALRYYQPPSAENLRRITELAAHVQFGTEAYCAQWSGGPCGPPSYADTAWLVNRLGSSAERLALPCTLFAQHPELIAAVSDRFGGSGDNFLPEASCNDFKYPWPASIATVVEAVRPFDGDAFGRCMGTIRFAEYARFRYDELLARVAPRLLLSQPPMPQIDDGDTSWTEYGRPYPLEAWSYQSAANRRAFLGVAPLFRHAIDDLAAMYRDRFQLGSEDASTTAYFAVRSQLWWTFDGSPSPLAVAIMRSDAKPGLTELLAAHARISSTNEPPLSLAAGHAAAMRLLMAAHASVEATNVFGKTPLMTAAQSDDPEGVAVLLMAAADVNRQSLSPDKILGNDPDSPDQPGCGDLRIRHGSRSALMYAAAGAGLPVIRALLHAGADIALRDSTGLTALDYLQGRGPVPANTILDAADFATATRLLTAPAATP